MVNLLPRIPHCGCMSVRMGCLIFAYFQITLALAMVIVLSTLKVSVPVADHHISKMVGIVGLVCSIVINVIFAVALHRYIGLIVKIYEIFYIVMFVLVVISAVMAVVYLSALGFLFALLAAGKLFFSVLFYAGHPVLLGMMYVIVLFVHSAYLEIKEKETEDVTETRR